VIDDAPNDRTLEISQAYAKIHKEIRVISNKTKIGVGNAIKEGIEKAENEVIIITVAGKHADPNDLVKMAEKMNEGYDMVFGDRFSNGLRLPGYQLKKLIANRLCNLAISVLFGIKARDITSGVKAYKAEILKKMEINSKGFEIFVEMPVKAYIMGNKNFAVIELAHKGRDAETSHFNLVNEWPKYLRTVMKCFIYKLKYNRTDSLKASNVKMLSRH